MASTRPKKKYTLPEIKTLGHQLLSSRAHINNLPLLLTFISPNSPPPHILESLLSLQSFFTPLLPELPPSSSSKASTSNDDPEFIYRTWLRSKFDEFVKSLIDVLVSPQTEETLNEILLDTIMELAKLGSGGKFNSSIYHKLLHSIVYSTIHIESLVDLLALKFFKYIDVCYFTYISLEKLVRTLEAKDISGDQIASSDGADEGSLSSSKEHIVWKIHYMISRAPPPEHFDGKVTIEMWSTKGFLSKESDQEEHFMNLKAGNKQLKMKEQNSNVTSAPKITRKMKLKFTKAWISYLRLPLPVDVYKEVLVNLHQAVIPHMSNPIMLCDFLTRSYDIGGVVSVMALGSLFILMTQYGLEYPKFYEKLYVLLGPSIFLAKYRAKFFQLLDSSLKSPLLPAYLAASFAKKLSRLSLSVSPSGVLVIISLIHNLLLRHPSINFLVHQEDSGNHNSETEHAMENLNKSITAAVTCSGKSGMDDFDYEESNPMKSNAMRSSLWEIDTVRHHYCPPVSRFVSSLENDLTVRRKTTEINVGDFSSGSYATIFNEEMRRRVKQVPLAFYKATPTCLFSDSDFAGWTFKYENQDITGGGDNDNSTIDVP